ncbi:hypothetical protein V1L52_08180 [Treponema sp. HNW]|uniref:hypothetical protein n=1 Tax=Treponema sp. HNW TaxID=3116654 RepID=UPI003D0D3CC7
MKLNKKMLIVLSILFIVDVTCFAKIIGSRFKITESEKEFDVIYYLTEDMKVEQNKQNNDVNITQTFKIEKNGQKGELRYSLFTDMGEDDSDIKMQYAMWVFMCINNIAGFEVPSNIISSFNDNDVKNEFNGNFGCTAFLQDPKSEYSEGYKYMMVEFFYKEKQGLVMRVFLFNGIDFAGINEDGSISAESPLFTNYHTFRFMEKDENGNFIDE